MSHTTFSRFNSCCYRQSFKNHFHFCNQIFFILCSLLTFKWLFILSDMSPVLFTLTVRPCTLNIKSLGGNPKLPPNHLHRFKWFNWWSFWDEAFSSAVTSEERRRPGAEWRLIWLQRSDPFLLCCVFPQWDGSFCPVTMLALIKLFRSVSHPTSVNSAITAKQWEHKAGIQCSSFSRWWMWILKQHGSGLSQQRRF